MACSLFCGRTVPTRIKRNHPEDRYVSAGPCLSVGKALEPVDSTTTVYHYGPTTSRESNPISRSYQGKLSYSLRAQRHANPEKGEKKLLAQQNTDNGWTITRKDHRTSTLPQRLLYACILKSQESTSTSVQKHWLYSRFLPGWKLPMEAPPCLGK